MVISSLPQNKEELIALGKTKDNRKLDRILDRLIMGKTLSEEDIGELKTVRAAFELARLAHSGSYRSSGASYVSHAWGTALLCAEYKFSLRQVAESLIHDVVEKGRINGKRVTYDYVKRIFGERIAKSVAAVSVAKWNGKRWIYPDHPGYHSIVHIPGNTLRLRRKLKRERELDLQKRISSDPDAPVVKALDTLHNLKTYTRLPQRKIVGFYLKYKSRLLWLQYLAKRSPEIRILYPEIRQSFSNMESNLIGRQKIADRHVIADVLYHGQTLLGRYAARIPRLINRRRFVRRVRGRLPKID